MFAKKSLKKYENIVLTKTCLLRFVSTPPCVFVMHVECTPPLPQVDAGMLNVPCLHACWQLSQDTDMPPVERVAIVTFQQFLAQYKEISDWLNTIQSALNHKAHSSLALAEKYLNRVLMSSTTNVFYSLGWFDYNIQFLLIIHALGMAFYIIFQFLSIFWTVLVKISGQKLNHLPSWQEILLI